MRKAYDFQENLIQSSIDGIIAVDKDGTIVVFNRGAGDLLGYTADEVVGKMHMDSIYPPGVGEMINKTLNAEAHGGKNRLVNYENALISKSGKEIPVRISGTVLFENGATTGGCQRWHFEEYMLTQGQDIPAPDGYVEKPMNPDTVLKLVSDLLS